MRHFLFSTAPPPIASHPGSRDGRGFTLRTWDLLFPRGNQANSPSPYTQAYLKDAALLIVGNVERANSCRFVYVVGGLLGNLAATQVYLFQRITRTAESEFGLSS